MQIGLLTREGRHLIGRIGTLVLAWARHEGGKLCVSYRVADKPVPIGDFMIHAKLEETTLCSAYDPDPRLIPVEAGPHRLALRAVQRLYDDDGIHLGDAMQETWAWSDGSLYLNAMLRVVHPERGGRLTEAAAEFAFADGWAPAEAEGIHLVHEDGGHLAVLRYGDGGLWTAPPGEEDPDWSNRHAWEMVGDGPSYYRRWGPYYEQWGGSAGWASMELEDGPAVRAVWAEGESRDRDSFEAFQGTLALLVAGDEEALARKVRSFKHLLTPSVEGGKILYHSPMEGTTAIRKTDECLKVTFPADPEEREARLHIRGAGGRRIQRVSGDVPAIGFPVTDGGVSDDPNGPNLLRPDDRHGPILTDADVRPDELLTTVSLAAGRAIEVELTSTPGLWMACQQWDDRQNLLLFSSAHPQGNMGAFSLRDLKMRDLKIPGYPNSIMALLPLYWFKANSSSAHHCLNVPREIDLIENGPDAIRFRVIAQNPAGTALSEIDVCIPFRDDRLQIDLVCRFTALEGWDLPEIQYCNFFPENTRYLGPTWNSDRVLVMAGDGQRTRTDHRATGASRVQSGAQFLTYDGNLFLALYGGPGGNVLVLSRPREIGEAKLGYQLCEAWLDNHLFLTSDEGAAPAGTRYEMELSLIMAHTTNVDEDIEEIGRQALDSRVLR